VVGSSICANFRKSFPHVTVSKFNFNVEYQNLHVKSFMFLKIMGIIAFAISNTLLSILGPSTGEFQSRSQTSPSDLTVKVSVCFCSSVLQLLSV